MGNVYTKSGALARRIYFGATTVWENLYYFLQKRVLADGGTFVENDVLISDDGAILILTPNAFKVGKLYSAKPDFGAGDFTVDRDSEATYTGQDGTRETALANVPRIEDGAILIEPQSTNLYLNSDVLATQNITTTASSYTVSFYGTGTITFSGSYSGSLVGTGAAVRVSKTFTATAGTLTSSISGTVTEGQCENLSYSTSYIPTAGVTETRLADHISVSTPAGVTSITETKNGVEQAPITVIPATYTIPVYNLGDELVVNGGFDTDTDWVKGGVTISGGNAVFNIVAGNPRLSQLLGVAVGVMCKITYEIISNTSDVDDFRLYSGGMFTQTSLDSSAGIHTLYLPSISLSADLIIRQLGGTIGEIVLDNVSVKEVLSGGVNINKVTML